MIVVVDSGTGNFLSVVRMIVSLGSKVKLTSNYSEIEAAGRLPIRPEMYNIFKGLK